MSKEHTAVRNMESTLHELVALSDALSSAAAESKTERNTLSFLAYEIDDRVKQLREEWRAAFVETQASEREAA